MNKYIGIVVLCLSLLVAGTSLANDDVRQFATSDVYVKAMQLNQRLQTLLNSAKGRARDIPFDNRYLVRSIQPRHVFQRALEVERKLIGFINLNSMRARETSTINILDYSPNEVLKLINKMDQQLSKIVGDTSVQIDMSAELLQTIKPDNVYKLLGRIELFLEYMGAPTSQPSQVLRRARAITQLLKDLCQFHQCGNVTYLPSPTDTRKRPIDVYKYAYSLIHHLERYIEKTNIKIEGGLYAAPPSEKVITPSDVNTTLGNLLADLIAIADAQGIHKRLNLSKEPEDVSPSEVWRELDYSFTILKHVLEAV